LTKTGLLVGVVDCDVGECSATCGGGARTCSRTCRNGSFGDQGCPADREAKSEDCNPQTCPSVTDCSDFGECSASCAGGTQTCTRTCENGVFGDDGCPADQETKSQACNVEDCPIKCPSETCWTQGADGTCTFNEADCPDMSVTCSPNGMSATFSRDLFDSNESTNFDVGSSSSSCQPVDNGAGNAVTWQSNLGNCGISVEKTTDAIVFTKTISAIQANDGEAITDPNRNAITIFLMEAPSARVTFQCSFPLTASVDSDEVFVTQFDVNSGAITATGNWNNAFDLKFTESDYTTLMNPKLNVIGNILYAAVNFSGLNVPLRWYISDCTVSGGGSTLQIVSNTCYAEFVNAKYGGAVTNDPDADKQVTSSSRFQYNSFAFGKGAQETQTLQCDITFCLEDEDSAECNLGDLTCPSEGYDAVFQYTTYGAV